MNNRTSETSRQFYARLAGVVFLLYIAFGILGMVMFNRATGAPEIAEKLAGIAQHATDIRFEVVLSLFCAFSALVLGVSLYAITHLQDSNLAMLALIFRVVEGVIIAVSLQRSLGLIWLATATGTNALDNTASQNIGAFLLLGQTWIPVIAGSFFSVGSALFSFLLLHGRMIPVPLAWLGVIASILLVVGLPLQLAGLLGGLVAQLIWLPMAAFEVSLALWFLIKGVAVQPVAS